MAWKNVQYENGKMRTSSGGSGGASNFADLEDVDLSNLQDGQVPKYNATTQKWENANESGGSGHTYSTTERVIGTWIDGKPVYEKTLHVTSIVANDNWQNIENLSVKLLIGFECIGYTSSGESGDQTSFRSDKNTPQIQAVSSTGYIRYALISGTSISELYIIARYTKTTD